MCHLLEVQALLREWALLLFLMPVHPQDLPGPGHRASNTCFGVYQPHESPQTSDKTSPHCALPPAGNPQVQGAPDTSIVDGSGIDLAKNVTAVQQYDQTHVNAVSRLCKACCAQAQSFWQACCAPGVRPGGKHPAQAGESPLRACCAPAAGRWNTRCAVARPPVS